MILESNNDPRSDEAARLVKLYQLASCSFLQRQLKIGCTEASRVVEVLALNDLLPKLTEPFTMAHFTDEWLAGRAFSASPDNVVPASFFEVSTGICFSDEDLYVALLANSDASHVRLSYSMGKVETWQSVTDLNPVVDSVLNDTRPWPADGLAIKITASPSQLLGRDLKQICSTLLRRANKHCSSALAIQYSEFSEDLVIEVIASKIFPR